MSALRMTANLLLIGLMGIIAISGVYSAAQQDLADERLGMVGFAVVCATLTISLVLRLRSRSDRERDRNLRDPKATFVIAGPLADRKRYLFFSLGVGIGSALIAASGLDDPLNQASAIFCAMLFGIAAPAFLLTRLKPRRLVFSPRGIDYSFFAFGPVAWSDLRRVHHTSTPRDAMVLSVVDEEKYWSRAPEEARRAAQADRAPATAGFHIDAKDLGVRGDLLMTAAQLRLTAFADQLTAYDDDDDDKGDKDQE